MLSLGTSSDEEAAALVGRLRTALRRPYRVDGGLVEIDASIGWSLFPQDGLTRASSWREQTVRCTPRSATRATTSVRDRRSTAAWCATSSRRSSTARSSSTTSRSSRMHTGEIQAVEALVRRSAATGSSAPSEFVPHLERTPLVRTLTLAVAKDALTRLAEWDRDGHRLDVAVNIPYRMLDDADLVDGLADS